MKNITIIILLLILLLSILFSCKKSRIKNQGCGEPPVSVIFDSGFIAMPNIFTPNGDGINDVLPVYAKGISEFKLEIKKLSGKTVFETTSTDNWWDGTVNSEGREHVYKYELTATTITGLKVSRVGTILNIATVGDKYCVEQAGRCVFGDMWHEGGLGYVVPTSEPLFENMSCD